MSRAKVNWKEKEMHHGVWCGLSDLRSALLERERWCLMFYFTLLCMLQTYAVNTDMWLCSFMYAALRGNEDLRIPSTVSHMCECMSVCVCAWILRELSMCVTDFPWCYFSEVLPLIEVFAVSLCLCPLHRVLLFRATFHVIKGTSRSCVCVRVCV